MLATPFLQANPSGYFERAFEFGRQFMFKWTVNWRFVPEEIFLSKEFWLGLVALHLLILVIFGVTSFLKPSGTNLPNFVNNFLTGRHHGVVLHPSFIMTVLLTTLAIGLLCARSIHYQFFAYLSWASPFLLWRAHYHPALIYALWIFQELAWNVYPSTNLSSAVVVLLLCAQVFGILKNRNTAFPTSLPRAKAKEHIQ